MVLVTGGTGLVGSHLLFDLLLQGYEVKALVRKSSNRESILQTFSLYTAEPQGLYQKINWVEGDVTDIFSLEDAFEGVDQVIHAAALVSFNARNKKDLYKTNIDGTSNIVNLCLEKQIAKLCFVSSIAALGVTEDGSAIHENVLWKPIKNDSAYSISKYRAEMEVWRGITEGLNAVIVNPSVILGPVNRSDGSASLFHLIGKGFRFYTLGTTGFVDVRDVTRAIVVLIKNDISGERFVLSSQNLSYKDLFGMIAKSLHVKPPHIYVRKSWAAILWRLEALKSVLFFTTPKLTQSAVNISYKKMFYTADKIKAMFSIEFRPVEQTIGDIGTFYKKTYTNALK